MRRRRRRIYTNSESIDTLNYIQEQGEGGERGSDGQLSPRIKQTDRHTHCLRVSNGEGEEYRGQVITIHR